MKILNSLQQRILALEPLTGTSDMGSELIKKLLPQSGRRLIPFNMGWALVLAFKAGRVEALEQAAALVDTEHVLRRPTNSPNSPGLVHEETISLSEDDYRDLIRRIKDQHHPVGLNEIHPTSIETDESLALDRFFPAVEEIYVMLNDHSVSLHSSDLDLLTKEEWQLVSSTYSSLVDHAGHAADKIGAIKLIWNIINKKINPKTNVPYGLREAKDAFEKVFEGRGSQPRQYFPSELALFGLVKLPKEESKEFQEIVERLYYTWAPDNGIVLYRADAESLLHFILTELRKTI